MVDIYSASVSVVCVCMSLSESLGGEEVRGDEEEREQMESGGEATAIYGCAWVIGEYMDYAQQFYSAYHLQNNNNHNIIIIGLLSIFTLMHIYFIC